MVTGHVCAGVFWWVDPRRCPSASSGPGNGLLFWCKFAEQVGVVGGVGFAEDPFLCVLVWRRSYPVCPVYVKWCRGEWFHAGCCGEEVFAGGWVVFLPCRLGVRAELFVGMVCSLPPSRVVCNVSS